MIAVDVELKVIHNQRNNAHLFGVLFLTFSINIHQVIRCVCMHMYSSCACERPSIESARCL